MNPALMATILDAAKRFTNSKGGQITMVISLVVVIFFVARGVWSKAKKSKAIKEFKKFVGTDLNALARRYRAAFNPSGIDRLINWDTSKPELILQLAEQHKGQTKLVSDQYKKIDPEDFDLDERVEKELSASQFGTWNAIIS